MREEGTWGAVTRRGILLRAIGAPLRVPVPLRAFGRELLRRGDDRNGLRGACHEVD